MSESVLKLANVHISGEAWKRLAGLKFPAPMAYRLLKHIRKVGAEAEIIEQERVRFVREACGILQGDATLQAGTPEHTAFVERFGALLETPCDLEPFPITIDRLLDTLGTEQGNVLSPQDLALLEPFFQEEKA